MKLRVIIEEITDDIKDEYSSGFKYDKEQSGYGYYRYEFTVGDVDYIAEISGVDCHKRLNCKMHSVSFHTADTGDQGITGTGNVREVFSTVTKITKDFLSKNPNENLFFSSGDGDRVRDLLYKRFTKEAKSIFPGYVGISSETEGGNMFVVPIKNAEKFVEYYKGLDPFERNFTIHK